MEDAIFRTLMGLLVLAILVAVAFVVVAILVVFGVWTAVIPPLGLLAYAIGSYVDKR